METAVEVETEWTARQGMNGGRLVTFVVTTAAPTTSENLRDLSTAFQ